MAGAAPLAMMSIGRLAGPTAWLLLGWVAIAGAAPGKGKHAAEIRAQQQEITTRATALLGPNAKPVIRFAQRTADLAESRLARSGRKPFVEKSGNRHNLVVEERGPNRQNRPDDLDYSVDPASTHNAQISGARLELGPPELNYRREYGAALRSVVLQLRSNLYDPRPEGPRRLVRKLTRAFSPLADGSVLERADYTVDRANPRANGADVSTQTITRTYRHVNGVRAPMRFADYVNDMAGAPSLASSSFLYHDDRNYGAYQY